MIAFLQKNRALSIGIAITLVGIPFFLIFRNPPVTVTVKRGDLVEAVYSLGVVKSDNSYVLKFGISAGISELFVEEGNSVTVGQTLLTNDSGINFKSPIDGTITKLNLSKGEVAMPGIPVLEVTDLKKVYIQVSLDQESALRVKSGQIANLSFESLRGHTSKAIVKNIYPSQGQFLVRLDPEDLPQGILPDMTADVAIEIDKKSKVILVPLSAVDKGKVLRLRSGKKQKTEIKLGITNSEFGELIFGDLLESDALILPRK